jgi:hypothetical protein
MKALFFGMLLGLLATFNAQADFFGGDDCPPWEYDCNDWPEWTPMYWMEEMMDEFDDDDDEYYRYGGYGYGPYAPAPYAQAPYGYGAQFAGPYGQPPVPYASIPAPVAPQAPAAAQ